MDTHARCAYLLRIPLSANVCGCRLISPTVARQPAAKHANKKLRFCLCLCDGIAKRSIRFGPWVSEFSMYDDNHHANAPVTLTTTKRVCTVFFVRDKVGFCRMRLTSWCITTWTHGDSFNRHFYFLFFFFVKKETNYFGGLGVIRNQIAWVACVVRFHSVQICTPRIDFKTL